MCRSIRRLRSAAPRPTTGDLDAAALQFVRKVSGLRAPSRTATLAFDAAVAEIAAATGRLLAALDAPAVDGPPTPPDLWPALAPSQRQRSMKAGA